jgi:hypothetical protein
VSRWRSVLSVLRSVLRSMAAWLARISIVATACVIATVWVGWVSVPVVGLAYGVMDRSGRAHGTVGAIAGALGWLAILCARAARGADVQLVARQVGKVMQLPAFALVIITLAFAVSLCGTSAVLGAWVGRAATRRSNRTAVY